MKTIGVDLDDVLLNFNDAFLLFYNSRYGTAYKREEITSFNLEDLYGLSVEVMHQRIQDFYHSDEHKNAEPVIGAIDGITKLAKNNNIQVITASPAELKEEILLWLGKHFSNTIKDIHFTRKNLFDKNPRKKADICKELGIELFIEDSIQNAEGIAALGIPVLLLDTPWNQGVLPGGVTRVYSWPEILKEIQGL